jgi:hypothetical protein
MFGFRFLNSTFILHNDHGYSKTRCKRVDRLATKPKLAHRSFARPCRILSEPCLVRRSNNNSHHIVREASTAPLGLRSVPLHVTYMGQRCMARRITPLKTFQGLLACVLYSTKLLPKCIYPCVEFGQNDLFMAVVMSEPIILLAF